MMTATAYQPVVTDDGKIYTICPECKGTGFDCDDDYCDEPCWYCLGCGVLVDCIDDMCAADVQDDWCL